MPRRMELLPKNMLRAIWIAALVGLGTMAVGVLTIAGGVVWGLYSLVRLCIG